MRRRKARKFGAFTPDFGDEFEVPDAGQFSSWINEVAQVSGGKPGTREGESAERWIAQRFLELGLEDVALDPVPIDVHSPGPCALDVGGHVYTANFVPNTGFSGTEGILGELVHVGKDVVAGTSGGEGELDPFESRSVRGKIVVAEVGFPVAPTDQLIKLFARRGCIVCSQNRARTRRSLSYHGSSLVSGVPAALADPYDVYWRAEGCGAAGICLVLTEQATASNKYFFGAYDGMVKPLPGLWINKDGMDLLDIARAGTVGKMIVPGKSQPGIMHNVLGVLRGMSDEGILIRACNDSPFAGAVEDGAGVAQVFAQIKAWSRIPRDKRPLSIVFLVTGGRFFGYVGGETFSTQHGDLLRKVRLAISLSHVGVREVQTTQHGYEKVGRPAFKVMRTTKQAETVAIAQKALSTEPEQATVLSPTPGKWQDAEGIKFPPGVAVIWWGGTPCYLLSEKDATDVEQVDHLVQIAHTLTELVKEKMLM